MLNNRLAAALCAVVVLVIQGEFSQLKNTAPLYKYFLVSISNVLATACQYEALKWVTLPTQTLAKCAKMVPVMIWGTLIDKKKYGVRIPKRRNRSRAQEPQHDQGTGNYGPNRVY